MNRSSPPIAAVAALAMLLAFAAVALIAIAPERAPAALPRTSLTIDLASSARADVFSGRVSSHQRKCLPQRKVVVYLKRGGADRAVGSDSSAANGAWKVNAGRAATGDYYARSKATATCAAATSSVVTKTS